MRPNPLPQPGKLLAAAVRALNDSYEREAADLLARCRLELSETSVHDPWRSRLIALSLVLIAPVEVVARLEEQAEIRGRIRRALDDALGPTTYVARLVVSGHAPAPAADSRG